MDSACLVLQDMQTKKISRRHPRTSWTLERPRREASRTLQWRLSTSEFKSHASIFMEYEYRKLLVIDVLKDWTPLLNTQHKLMLGKVKVFPWRVDKKDEK